MQPVSPPASLAGWFLPLQHVLLYGAPILVVGWLLARRRAWTDNQLLWTMLGVTAIYLLLATFGWYVDRDDADTPIAAVFFIGCIIVPTLIAIGWVWRVAQRRAWSPAMKAGLSIVGGYVVGTIAYVPAVFSFLLLGGEQI